MTRVYCTTEDAHRPANSAQTAPTLKHASSTNKNSKQAQTRARSLWTCYSLLPSFPPKKEPREKDRRHLPPNPLLVFSRMRRLLSPGLAEKSCRFRFPKPFFDPANRAPKVAQRPTITISRPYDACHRTAERHQQWQQAYKLWRSIHKRCCFDCNSIWRLVIRNPLGQFWNIIKTSQQQVGDVTQLVYQTQRPVFL